MFDKGRRCRRLGHEIVLKNGRRFRITPTSVGFVYFLDGVKVWDYENTEVRCSRCGEVVTRPQPTS